MWRAAQDENCQRWTAPSFPRKATGVVHHLSAPVRHHLSIGFLIQLRAPVLLSPEARSQQGDRVIDGAQVLCRS